MHDWQTAEDHARRAWRDYERRRWGRALKAFERALAQQPDQAGWWLGRGLVLEALKRHADAADAYERAAVLRPDSADAWLTLGAARLRVGTGQSAIHALEQAQSLAPNRHESYCYRVAAYARIGDLDNAELMFYLGQQQHPDCPHCFDHVAHALANRGQLDRAAACWQRVRELDPAHPRVGINLGRCFAFLQRYGRAQHFYEQHLAHHPDDTPTALELVALLLERGRLDQAEQQLDAVRVVHHDDAATTHLRGDLALKRRDPHTAECYYRLAIQLDPDRPGVRLGLALAARERGDDDACSAYLSEELNTTGQDARQVLQLARLLIEQRRHRDAIALLTPALHDDDLFAGNNAMLGQALHIRAVANRSIGQHHDAIADARRAVRLDPANAKCWRLLIVGYRHTHRPLRARVCLKQALAACPADPHLRKLAHQFRWQRLTRAA
ncbi:MAG: tetratricopeptide repeat protein [Phycisphaerales bacterium JB063]